MTHEVRDTRRVVMEAIRASIEETGLSPTIRELRKRTGIASTSTVSYHLQRLRLDGLIEYTPGQARSIRLPDQKHSELRMLVFSSGSDKRRRVLEYIDWYWESYGRGPSYQDISYGVKLAKSGVFSHVKRLKKAGLLSEVEDTFRSVKVTELGKSMLENP